MGTQPAGNGDEGNVFPIVDSELVYRGRILAVRRDRVRMPGGAVATREVVEHNGAVAIAAIDEAGRVLLIRQYRHPLGRRMWELPAGLLDVPGEDGPTAARRELLEETGWVATRWEVLVDVANSPGFCDEVVRVYLAHGLHEAGRPEPGDDEEADLQVCWTALPEAVAMVLDGRVANSTAVAGILAAAAATGALGGAPVDTRPVDALWPDRPTALASRPDPR